jgi:hypothetical protein
MDKQEAKLQQQMAGTGVEVVRQGDNITLDMPSNVTFAFDSSNLNPQFDSVLDKVADTLKEYDKTVVEVAGHTDSVGSDAYNQTLSEARDQLITSSHGMTRADGHDRRGRGPPGRVERHRGGPRAEPRVEITIVPVSEENVRARSAESDTCQRSSTARCTKKTGVFLWEDAR